MFAVGDCVIMKLNLLLKNFKLMQITSNNVIFNKKAFVVIMMMIITAIILVIVFIKTINCKCKTAEKLLFESDSLLSTIINTIPDIIYFKSPEGKIIEVNEAILKLTRIDKENCINKELYGTFNKCKEVDSFLLNCEAMDRKAWEKGNVYRSEEVISDEKGTISKIYDNLRIPIFNGDGSPRGLVLIGRDITEHKLKEKNKKIVKELKCYNKFKTDFFSNISHELKTPLNVTFSALQVIELNLKNNNTEVQNKNLEKYTAIMRQNCYRLLRIINNLIDISKIDEGHFFMHFKNENIVSVVENIVLSIVDYVESKNISIIFDTEVEEKLMSFDPDAIERIILNLLSNAIKFTPSNGSIEVNIYDKVKSVIISIKDTGIGIPIEKQSEIFERFVQVDKSFSRNREGCGIGLSLSKELIVMHNGNITLESIEGKGSEFKVEIPVKILPKNKKWGEGSIFTEENKLEKIKIEFSDIYD
jgi:PAS domain S-box-containing protein